MSWKTLAWVLGGLVVVMSLAVAFLAGRQSVRRPNPPPPVLASTPASTADAPDADIGASVQTRVLDRTPIPTAVSSADANNLRSRQIDAVRAEIPKLIESKRWNDAEKRISELQVAVPDDPEAAAWRKVLMNLRVAQVMDNALAESPAPLVRAPVAPKPVAVARKIQAPAIAPVPVQSPVSLPASLALSVPPPVPQIQRTFEPSFGSRTGAIAGLWEYVSADKPKPEKTEKGKAYVARKVDLNLSPDGAGDLSYDLGTADNGNWPFKSNPPAVRIRFRLTDWDGKKLVGTSNSHDYTVSIESGGEALKVDWKAIRRTDLRDGERLVNGTAVLLRKNGGR